MSEPPGESRPRQAAVPLSYVTPGDVDERWTTVFTAETLQEAHLAAGRLQAHGLHARVDGENASVIGSVLGPYPMLHARVQLLKNDTEEARELLRDVERTRTRRREALVVRCGKCGTPGQRLPHPVRRAGVIVLLSFVGVAVVATLLEQFEILAWSFLLLPLSVTLLVWSVTPNWLCPNCGAQWSQREPSEDDVEDDEQDPGEQDGEDEEDEEDEPSVSSSS